MKHGPSLTICLAAIALPPVLAFPAMAQVTPPTAPGNNIDSRVRDQLRPLTPVEQEEALLTGDTDILLTRPTRLFTLSGALDTSYTSNAFLAPTGAIADGYGQAQISVSAGTRVGGAVDIFASAGMVGVRYFEQGALDYNALSGLVGARAYLGRVGVTASYQPSVVFTRSFGSRQLTSHRFRLAAALPFQLRTLTIEPSVAVERVLANPSDYDAWSGSAGLTVSAPLSRKVPLLGYVTGQYERREFDAYFPDLVGVKRKDDGVSAAVGLIWQPRPWGQVRLSYAFQRNWSTSDVNRFEAHSGTLGLSASLRF